MTKPLKEKIIMKKTIILIAALLAFASIAAADEYVNGYVRKDGTYVQPHYRSSPNSSKWDNYSSKGNTNPYTGEKGSQSNEYSNPYGSTYKPYKPYGK